MKTNDEIYDFKMECREETLRDQQHELDMRNDIDYFLKNSSFAEFYEAYHKFLKELRDYDWDDKPEELAV